ncbi:hypothetical protein EDB92DRAFT_1276004 [Lactarius akahatsu]|uniref:Uncharacterized protein n=1 Tax=Lactarius akahatsu TaxID=416441 RepID=A0AAD4L6U7_9AGAM|nr:hypothetical protein EDB92DRAFT_1276004 [Lactarius akahatsu]
MFLEPVKDQLTRHSRRAPRREDPLAAIRRERGPAPQVVAGLSGREVHDTLRLLQVDEDDLQSGAQIAAVDDFLTRRTTSPRPSRPRLLRTHCKGVRTASPLPRIEVNVECSHPERAYYTGSTGFRDYYMQKLVGRCGTLDVEDATVDHLVKEGKGRPGEAVRHRGKPRRFPHRTP